MKCGKCKEDHDSVAEVRVCYGIVDADGPVDVAFENVTVTVGQTDERPITEKQYNLIQKLRAERGIEVLPESYSQAIAQYKLAWAKYVEIPRLFAIRPSVAPAQVKDGSASQMDVPEGRYAIDSLTGNNDLDFFKVDRPMEGKWAGYTFVKQIVGGHPEYAVKGSRKNRVLQGILDAGVDNSAMAYSRATSTCNKCGIDLTKYASRVLGKGHTCADKCGQGAEWNSIQRRWERDRDEMVTTGKITVEQYELATMPDDGCAKTIQHDDFEQSLDHDEYAKFERAEAEKASR
jgi:hypothetical protein